MKPVVPERESSLYDCLTSSQVVQGYQTFRTLTRPSCQTLSVPNLNGMNHYRRNSNSSSNEADEESSLSSLNSNHFIPINSESSEQDQQQTFHSNSSITVIQTNLSTFRTTNSSNGIPSKASDIKKRSNGRKQPSNISLSNNSNPSSFTTSTNDSTSLPLPPPPPPPPSSSTEEEKKILNENENSKENASTSDFQSQIEEAKNRLKKVDGEKNSNDECK